MFIGAFFNAILYGVSTQNFAPLDIVLKSEVAGDGCTSKVYSNRARDLLKVYHSQQALIYFQTFKR